MLVHGKPEPAVAISAGSKYHKVEFVTLASVDCTDNNVLPFFGLNDPFVQ